MTPQERLTLEVAGYATTAMATLIKLLEANGALQPGQFSEAVSTAIGPKASVSSSFEHRCFAGLLERLEDTPPSIQ